MSRKISVYVDDDLHRAAREEGRCTWWNQSGRRRYR